MAVQRRNIAQSHPHPFGMVMPGREYSGGEYKFGFNGKEQLWIDCYIFNHRIYESRIGRWFSLDPKQCKYPGLSGYNYSRNEPLLFEDKMGSDFEITIDKGKATITATIYPVNAEAAEQLTAATAAWNSLSGSQIFINGELYEVQINITIAPTPETPAQAESKQKEHAFSNIYYGENKKWLDENGNLIKSERKITMVEGVPSRTPVHAGSTLGGDHFQMSITNIEYLDKFGRKGFGRVVHHGRDPHHVAHEIGHLFGLGDPPKDNDHQKYFPQGGVMEYKDDVGAVSSQMPTIYDLRMILEVALAYANGSEKNDPSNMQISINIAKGVGLDLSKISVRVPIDSGVEEVCGPAPIEGTDPGIEQGNKLEI